MLPTSVGISETDELVPHNSLHQTCAGEAARTELLTPGLAALSRAGGYHCAGEQASWTVCSMLVSGSQGGSREKGACSLGGCLGAGMSGKEWWSHRRERLRESCIVYSVPMLPGICECFTQPVLRFATTPQGRYAFSFLSVGDSRRLLKETHLSVKAQAAVTQKSVLFKDVTPHPQTTRHHAKGFTRHPSATLWRKRFLFPPSNKDTGAQRDSMALPECDSGPGIALLGNPLAWRMSTGHETHTGLMQLVVESKQKVRSGQPRPLG